MLSKLCFVSLSVFALALAACEKEAPPSAPPPGGSSPTSAAPGEPGDAAKPGEAPKPTGEAPKPTGEAPEPKPGDAAPAALGPARAAKGPMPLIALKVALGKWEGTLEGLAKGPLGAMGLDPRMQQTLVKLISPELGPPPEAVVNGIDMGGFASARGPELLGTKWRNALAAMALEATMEAPSEIAYRVVVELPSNDPKALADALGGWLEKGLKPAGIEGARGFLTGAGPAIFVAPAAAHVRLTVLLSASPAPDWAAIHATSEASPVDLVGTPGWRAFEASKAPLSAHVRPRVARDLGASLGLVEAVNSLPSVRPDKRAQAHRANMEMVLRAALGVLSYEGAHFDEHLTVCPGGDLGACEATFYLTKAGRAACEAAASRPRARLAVADDDTSVLWLAGDVAAMRKAAPPPSWRAAMSGDDIALRMSEAGLWGYLNLFSYGLDVSGVVVGLTGALRDASSVPPPASVGVAMPLGDPQGLSVALLFDKARVSLEALTKIAEGARRPFKVEAVARGEWTALLMSRDGKAGERFGEPVAMGPGEVLRYAGNTWRCAGGALVSGDGSAAVPDGSLAAESGAYHGKGRRCLDEASRQLLRASGAAGKPTPEALKKAIFQALDCAAGDPATAAEAQAVRKLVESQALPALEHLAKVVQGSDVRLATGLGLDEVPDEVPLPVVAVSGARITVDGEQIVEVECTTESGMACTDADRNKPTNSYAIPARFKEDQSEYSFMVPSLEEALKAKLQMGEGLRKRPVQRARVAVDKYIPFRILVEVVHSMGMAGYSEIYLLVRRRGDAPGELGAIKVLIPKLGKPTPGEVDPPYNLTVLVDTKGIATKINVASISEGWGAGRMYRKLDPRGAEALPLDELYARLSAVKAGRPELGIVNLGADMHRPWHEVAAVIEATRRVLPKGAADSLEAFEAAFAAPPLERDPMFPHTVFVVAE